MDETGEVTTAKAPSTDDVRGFFGSIETAAAKLDYGPDEIFDRIVRVTHGTTVARNIVVEQNGNWLAHDT